MKSSTYSAGAIHFKGAIDHVIHRSLDSLGFGRVVGVVHNAFVEIAVTNMA